MHGRGGHLHSSATQRSTAGSAGPELVVRAPCERRKLPRSCFVRDQIKMASWHFPKLIAAARYAARCGRCVPRSNVDVSVWCWTRESALDTNLKSSKPRRELKSARGIALLGDSEETNRTRVVSSVMNPSRYRIRLEYPWLPAQFVLNILGRPHTGRRCPLLLRAEDFMFSHVLFLGIELQYMVRSFSHFLFLRHRIMCWPGPLPKG